DGISDSVLGDELVVVGVEPHAVGDGEVGNVARAGGEGVGTDRDVALRVECGLADGGGGQAGAAAADIGVPHAADRPDVLAAGGDVQGRGRVVDHVDERGAAGQGVHRPAEVHGRVNGGGHRGGGRIAAGAVIFEATRSDRSPGQCERAAERTGEQCQAAAGVARVGAEGERTTVDLNRACRAAKPFAGGCAGG